MNNSRRKRINQSISSLIDTKNKLQIILSEEQKALKGLPEDDEYDDMRDGMEDIISGLEETLSSLNDTIDTLEGADF